VERPADAIPFSQQSLDLFGELADRNRDVYLYSVAISLQNHGQILTQADRAADAAPFSQRSVDLFRELADRNRDLFPSYAQSVLTLGWVLAECDRDAEAITYMVKGFMLCQQLPEHAQGPLDAAIDLLRIAYAQEPAAVAREFRAETDWDVPSGIAEPFAPPE
jgi:hypothetical protein